MSDEKKLSVVVGVYNTREDKLRRCIQSIIHQTYNNLEIILLDDGSTNNAGWICDEFAKKNSRIKVFHQENFGAHAKFEQGYLYATGDYLTNVDHDDFLELDYYEKLMKVANVKGADVIDSGYCQNNLFTNQVEERYVGKYFEINDSRQIIEASTTGKIATDSWCRIFKRELMKKGKQWELSEPLTFIGATTLIHIPIAGYHFDNWDNSTGNRLDEWMIEQLEKCASKDKIKYTMSIYPYLGQFMKDTRFYWLKRCYLTYTFMSKPASVEEEQCFKKLKIYLKYDAKYANSLNSKQKIVYFLLCKACLRFIIRWKQKIKKESII